MSKQTLLVGAHLSTAGGIETAIERATQIKATAIQIFTRTSRSWTTKPYSDDEVNAFINKQNESNIQRVVSHASYLINLGSSDPALAKKSIDALTNEITRCDLIRIPSVVLHPGAHVGAGYDIGIQNIAQGLNTVFSQTPNTVSVALETMAGQGSTIGHSFEQLAQIAAAVSHPERIAFCLDTCHMHAAGHNFSTKKDYDELMNTIDRLLGLKNVHVMHINDAKVEHGSRKDRHEKLGLGKINIDVFRWIVNDQRLAHAPKILETPELETHLEYAQEIKLLQGFVET
jgi:deoxyribonuclease-4